jgi:hypothetical protein
MTINDVPDRESDRKDAVTNIVAEKLLHSLKSTSASRFNAAKRLTAKDRALTRLTAFTSAYLIVLTALPYFMKLPQEVTDNLSLVDRMEIILRFYCVALTKTNQFHVRLPQC